MVRNFAAIALGQRAFGESYLQEALAKREGLDCPDCQWHFIGPLQSNKTAPVAAAFDWVHSLDREKIARRLNDQRPTGLPPLNVCLQFNVSDEASKSGIRAPDLAALAGIVGALPRLRLRGLMAIPRPSDDLAHQRDAFRRVHEALEGLNAAGFALDTLSMGMSGDYPAAIAAGASRRL